MPKIFLAHISEPERPLHRRLFPSKVGGKPAWLDPVNLPEHLFCNECSQPLTFILQIYAPLPHVFHRSLFLFACHSCSNRFVVLRSQLDLENPYYPNEPFNGSDSELEDDDCLINRCCPACGIPSEVVVEDGSDTCVRIHKRCVAALSWPKGIIPVIFEEGELEIYSMDETNLVLDVSACVASATIASASNLDQSEEEAFEEISKENSRKEEDKAFDRFSKLLEQYPGHIMRYYSNQPKTPLCSPMWVSDKHQFTDAELVDTVKPCEQCGGPRQLEFQVLPTLISELESTRLTFATIAVYTCVDSCNISGYVEEFVVVQKEGDLLAVPKPL